MEGEPGAAALRAVPTVCPTTPTQAEQSRADLVRVTRVAQSPAAQAGLC